MQSVFEDELKAYVEASNHTEDQVLKLFDRTYVNPIRVRLASTCLLLEVIVLLVGAAVVSTILKPCSTG